MKSLVLSITAAVAVLCMSGCCTSSHKVAWEYKTYQAVAPANWTGSNPLDDGLNKLSAEGWTIQSFSPSPARSDMLIFLLTRPKQ